MEQTEIVLEPRANREAAEGLRMPSRPYPGLRPFEESEAGIFFGREQHRNRLLEILQRRRFLAVIGPSGSGKSSLVRAGLLPILPLGAIGTGSKWRVATLRPGYRPLRSLAEELLKPEVLGRELAADLKPGDHGAAVALIEAALRRGRHSLLDLVTRAKSKAGCDEDNVCGGGRPAIGRVRQLCQSAARGQRIAGRSAVRRNHDADRLPRPLRALRRPSRSD
jgi:hypothetical protein